MYKTCLFFLPVHEEATLHSTRIETKCPLSVSSLTFCFRLDFFPSAVSSERVTVIIFGESSAEARRREKRGGELGLHSCEVGEGEVYYRCGGGGEEGGIREFSQTFTTASAGRTYFPCKQRESQIFLSSSS